jgi:hypothetical protein
MESQPGAPKPVDVATLAAYAALPLSPARVAAVETVLSAWIADANELSRKMSDPAHQSLMPVTTFTHAHDALEDKA